MKNLVVSIIISALLISVSANAQTRSDLKRGDTAREITEVTRVQANINLPTPVVTPTPTVRPTTPVVIPTVEPTTRPTAPVVKPTVTPTTRPTTPVISRQPIPTREPAKRSACADWDGGRNFYKAAQTIMTFPDGGEDKRVDYCKGNLVIEFYCEKGAAGDIMRTEMFQCQGGCNYGECKTITKDPRPTTTTERTPTVTKPREPATTPTVSNPTVTPSTPSAPSTPATGGGCNGTCSRCPGKPSNDKTPLTITSGMIFVLENNPNVLKAIDLKTREEQIVTRDVPAGSILGGVDFSMSSGVLVAAMCHVVQRQYEASIIKVDLATGKSEVLAEIDLEEVNRCPRDLVVEGENVLVVVEPNQTDIISNSYELFSVNIERGSVFKVDVLKDDALNNGVSFAKHDRTEPPVNEAKEDDWELRCNRIPDMFTPTCIQRAMMVNLKNARPL